MCSGSLSHLQRRPSFLCLETLELCMYHSSKTFPLYYIKIHCPRTGLFLMYYSICGGYLNSSCSHLRESTVTDSYSLVYRCSLSFAELWPLVARTKAVKGWCLVEEKQGRAWWSGHKCFHLTLPIWKKIWSPTKQFYLKVWKTVSIPW